MRTARMLCLGLLTLMVLLGGCQRQPAALTSISGKVAYRGVLLPGGTIVFTPDMSRGQSGPMALGKVNQDGSYQLYTGDSPGAPAGWYRVTVTSLVPSSLGQLSPFSVLPDKYRDPDLSQLPREIKADRANVIDFNLD